MKVVFLADDFPPESFGGAGISTYELAKGVQDAGHEVFVITTCRDKREAGRSEYDGLPVFKIQSDYPERWRAWRSLYNPPVVRQVEKILKEIRPDAVHANNIHLHLSYYCLKIAKRYAKRVIITFRDAMAVSYGKLATKRYFEHGDLRLTWRDQIRQAGKRYNPFRNVCIRYALRYADAKFAVSDALRDALKANGITGVETIHTGIDTETWQMRPELVAKFKARYGLAGRRVILFGGRLAAAAAALRVMHLLAPSMPDAVLVIMGRKEEWIERAAKDLPVVFTGWLSGEEKKAAYGASDIVWVPSTYLDAFPRSALEAQAAGKPVIATKFGGAPELVLDGQTGFVVNPFRPQEMVDKTLILLLDPTAAAFGAAGRTRVSQYFNLTQYVASYIESYSS